MNIIRDGDKDRLDPIYRFVCYRCGCIWECHQSECLSAKIRKEDYLFYGGSYVDKIYKYKCPCCESVATGESVHDIELRTCYKG